MSRIDETKKESGKLPFYIKRKLDKLGKKLKKKEDEPEDKEKVELLGGNFEIADILPSLINNHFSEMSGKHLVNAYHFKYLTKLYKHKEEKLNYIKYEGVIAHLNAIKRDKEALQKRRAELKKKQSLRKRS